MSGRIADLTAAAGLAVALDEATGELRFGDGATSEPPAARMLEDLRGVLRDPDADGAPLAYRLYRGVRRVTDEPLLTAAGFRYDLTVTLPGRLGAEYAKTAGHYHPADPDSGVSFPELYEVVHGRAAFVHQRVADVNPAYGATPAPLLAHGSRAKPFLADRGPAYAHFAAAPDEWAFLDRPAQCADALLALWRPQPA